MFGEEEQEQYQPQGYQYQPCNQNTQELRIIYLMANILVNLLIIPFPPVKMHVPIIHMSNMLSLEFKFSS